MSLVLMGLVGDVGGSRGGALRRATVRVCHDHASGAQHGGTCPLVLA
jgi:hypothetical protein